MEKAYTVKEVAALLRISTATVYRHIENGELDFVRIGKRWRMPAHQLEKYLSWPASTAHPS